MLAVLGVLLVLCAAGACASLALGSEPIAASAVWDVLAHRLRLSPGPDPTVDLIVVELRAPRAAQALVVGAGLGVAGTAVQALVRNPLADPYLLGVSSGASVGATAVITTGALAALGTWALSAGALLGALAATALVFGIASAQGGLTPLRLVLTGVVMSSAFSSVASFLVMRSDDRGAQSVLFWLLGSLSGTTWAQVWLPAVAVVATTALLLASSWIDALTTGEDGARAVGVPVDGLRRALFVLSSALVGVLVAVSGSIGFVGLVLPHLGRLVVGARHRVLLPVAALGGAAFLIWVDVLSRVVVRPVELPLSVVTGLVGAPVFLLLLGRRRYSYGSAV
ncbi:sugar ABC transporter substrate-binding protein [Luteipulveratus halotolerans]|uniref:Sugar ABC transporter substrate-binding protein n=2 Tax=Luteipulveratus halotolerans TaxID=1631356 RepID=A0A0L6CH36_9MICO|nr:sugar ABC transporter substrate-binding protein [Luteipulveratus halotolerans]